MSVLDSVLRYKEYKDAQDTQKANAIPQAINSFLSASQQAQQLQNQNLITQLTAAKQGFRIENGQLVKDESLGGGLDYLKQQDLISKINNRATTQELLQKALNGQGDNLPPGSRITAGGVSIPLNQKLTEAEQSAVAGVDKFEPLVSDIQSLIDKGVFADKGVKRGYQQFLAEGGGDPIRRFLTPDNSDLEALASAAAEMKKFAFAEGGKQLSPTEKQVVEAGLSFTGKSDKAIKRDFSAAIDILRKKKILAVGGANSINEKKEPSGKTNSIHSFNTVEDAEAANLPSGTEIMIGGRKARVK